MKKAKEEDGDEEEEKGMIGEPKERQNPLLECNYPQHSQIIFRITVCLFIVFLSYTGSKQTVKHTNRNKTKLQSIQLVKVLSTL